jgi:hypothetical protein
VPSHPKRPRDPAQLAKLIVDIATGEVEHREPTDRKHISTSFAERQNLNLRMHMRRFTRLPLPLTKRAASIPQSSPHPSRLGYHVPARARRIAGLSGFLTLSQSRDGPDR